MITQALIGVGLGTVCVWWSRFPTDVHAAMYAAWHRTLRPLDGAHITEEDTNGLPASIRRVA